MVQWLLEYGGAQITDINIENASVWCEAKYYGLANVLESAYTKYVDDKYVSIEGKYVPNGGIVQNGDIGALTSMLRVMVLHGCPPESLTKYRHSSRSCKTARGYGHGSRHTSYKGEPS
jgi:hypothetical protein